jgi:hypothetical protein
MKFILLSLFLSPLALLATDTRQVGVASVDITPEYPVRLSGYGGRRSPNTGVAQHIFAKALAIGGDEEGPAVVVTVARAVAVVVAVAVAVARRCHGAMVCIRAQAGVSGAPSATLVLAARSRANASAASTAFACCYGTYSTQALPFYCRHHNPL